LDLIAALAREADRRGHKLAISRKRKPRGLYLSVSGYRCVLTLKEEDERIRHVVTEEERRRRKLYSWQRIPPEYDTVPSGWLRLDLVYSRHSRRTQWADKGKVKLESKLREIIREVERQAKAEEQDRIDQQQRHAEWVAAQEREETARKRKAADRRAKWEAAMAVARERAIDDHRRKVFGAAVDAWDAASVIREFCDALATSASSEGEQAKVVARWVACNGRSLSSWVACFGWPGA